MAQIFHPATTPYARLSILAAVLAAAGGVGLMMAFERSPYRTNEGVVYEQPIPFSHDHHTAALGIDCRYCHTTVEREASANIPATQVCMNCHIEIWKDSPMLEPVRASFRDNVAIEWNRVHDLPDFVYFNHSIHVAKGVGCETCHGDVTKMPLIARGAPLQMSWCLECHRNPEKFVRPPEEVFNFDWEPPADDPDYGAKRVEAAGIDGERRLTSCSTCHR